MGAIAGMVLTVVWPALAEDRGLSSQGEGDEFRACRAGGEVQATIRIEVTNTSLCRVTAARLKAAGVPAASLVGGSMRLFCRTQEVAILTSSTGVWNDTDYFLFYGQEYDGEYSGINSYWLGFGAPGRRMACRAAPPIPGVPRVNSFTRTIRFNQHLYYYDMYRPDDAALDHWFAKTLRNNMSAKIVLVTDGVAAGAAELSVVLYGTSSAATIAPDHCTRIRINSAVSADMYYDGQEPHQGVLSFAAAHLHPTNILTLTQILQAGVSADFALLKECSLAYPRSLTAGPGLLSFTGQPGSNTYQVRGLPGGADMFVLDVSDPANPVRLTGYATIPEPGGGIMLEFGDSRPDVGSYQVGSVSGVLDISATAIRSVLFRDLASEQRQADYIIICPYEFRAPVYRLLALRHKQGMTVTVAPLEDIYNEFNYGIADAVAIRRFLGYTLRRWRAPAPRYVLLAGTGTYDPRHYLYYAPELIPVHLGPTAYQWTALDGWYVQVGVADDALPAMALGRIPVETVAQMDAVVDKIVSFESVPAADPVRRRCLLVADRYDTVTLSNFKEMSAILRTRYLLPNAFQCVSLYVDDTVDYSPLSAAINEGVYLVNFLGHGAMDQWSFENIFNTASVKALTNTRFPLFVMLSCQNGAFQSPLSKCLVESLFETSTRGAVACVTASGVSSFGDGNYIGAGFYRALIDDRTTRLGDALLAGYRALYAVNPTTPELTLFGLFGDPALVVNRPYGR